MVVGTGVTDVRGCNLAFIEGAAAVGGGQGGRAGLTVVVVFVVSLVRVGHTSELKKFSGGSIGHMAQV